MRLALAVAGLAALMGCAVGSETPAPPSPPVTHSGKVGFRETDRKAMARYAYADTTQMRLASEFAAADEFMCGKQPACVAMFWADSSRAAHGRYVTDSDMDAMLFHYNRNVQSRVAVMCHKRFTVPDWDCPKM